MNIYVSTDWIEHDPPAMAAVVYWVWVTDAPNRRIALDVMNTCVSIATENRFGEKIEVEIPGFLWLKLDELAREEARDCWRRVLAEE